MVMSEVIDAAIQALTDKLAGSDFGNTAKFNIEGEGSIVIDDNGVREADVETEVTLNASAETFQAMFEGDLDPTAAFMTGKLTIDGNMGAAMQLAGILS
jgi:putative sterol carrier protein